jgi:hypothetical protein
MDLLALRKKLDAVPIESARLKFVGNNQVTNFGAFRNAVNQLALIPPLAHFTRDLQAMPFFPNNPDQFQLDANTTAQLRQKSDALFAAAASLKQIIDTLVPTVPPETVIVTLPSQKDLKTTTDLLDQFQKALAPLVFEAGIGGKIEVLHWQSGSLLVFLFVGAMAAVGIIARTLRAAAIAYQEIQKGRATAIHVDLLKEHVRESKLKNDLADVIAEAQKERIKAVVDRESKAVELDIFNASDNERLERIKHSVRTLAELFEQGATVSPALNMPEQEQAKFPDVEHLLTATPPIKQLHAGEPAAEADATSPPAKA